jgi:hypothetical protein
MGKYKEGFTKQGVRDLDYLHHRKRFYKVSGVPMPGEFRDSLLREVLPPISEDTLGICLEEDDRDKIRALWPEAGFEDWEDLLTGNRTTVMLPNIPQWDWLYFIIKNNLDDVSFITQVALLRHPTAIREILDDLDRGD